MTSFSRGWGGEAITSLNQGLEAGVWGGLGWGQGTGASAPERRGKPCLSRAHSGQTTPLLKRQHEEAE